MNAKRPFSTLILAEHLDGQLNSSVASCLKAAQDLNETQVDVLVHGSESSVNSQMDALSKYPGLNKVYLAKNDALENPYGHSVAQIAQNLV